MLSRAIDSFDLDRAKKNEGMIGADAGLMVLMAYKEPLLNYSYFDW